jgi:flavin reductase (DIM6/NTAB) family NADH-FMN oxidoreductase RutF
VFNLKRIRIDPFSHVKDTNKLMLDGGLLLVAQGRENKPNAMTIGWGFLGTLWRKPYFLVAVRKSRYTHELLEESSSFTICVPDNQMDNVLDVCGTKSGRDINKFKELGLTAVESQMVSAPYIGECPLHYECLIRHKTEFEPDILPKEIMEEIYPAKDMHVIYYGEVLGTYSIEDLANKL